MKVNTTGAVHPASIAPSNDNTISTLDGNATHGATEQPGQGGLQGASISVATGHQREATLVDASTFRDHLDHPLGEEIGESEDEFFDAVEEHITSDSVQGRTSVDAGEGEQSSDPAIGTAAPTVANRAFGALRTVMDGACTLGGAVIGALSGTAAINKAVDTVSTAVSGTVETLSDLRKNAIGFLAESKPVEVKSRFQANIDEMAELADFVDQEMHNLNRSILAITGVEVRPPEDHQINREGPSNWENISGKVTYVTAACSTLFATASTIAGTAAAAGAGVAVGSVLPIPGTSLAAAAGGVYATMSALKKAPELFNDTRVLTTINSKRGVIEPKLERMNALLKEERSRQDASHRHASIAMDRVERIKVLGTTIDQMREVVEARKLATPENDVEHASLSSASTQGNGSASAAILAKSKQSLAAFERFLAPLVASFKNLRAAAFPSQTQRSEKANRKLAQAAEAKFNASSRRMLSMLAMPDKSTLAGGADVHAAVALKKGGGPSLEPFDLLRSMTIGENLTRAITSSQEPNFGVARFKDSMGKAEFAVPSNLTTVRHVVRFLFAKAEGSSQPDDQLSDHNASLVENGVLELQDDARALYGFLVNAEGAMPRDGGGMMIKDHGRNLPQGASAVTFDTRIKNGKSVLVLDLRDSAAKSSLSTKQTYRKVFENMRAKLYVPDPASTDQTDYAKWPTARLTAALEKTQNAFEEELLLSAKDQKQIEALSTWANPAFENRA